MDSIVKKLYKSQIISLVLSISIFFLSFSCYNIFPKISDKVNDKRRNLYEDCEIKLLSSIEFEKATNKNTDFSNYFPLGKYRPKYLYEHIKTLNNGTVEYYHSNKSHEYGYEKSYKITNINKTIYLIGDYAIKVTYSISNIKDNFNVTTNSCNKGYKSCGKINIDYYFIDYCVEENNECPIKIMLFSSNSEYSNDGIIYKTKQIGNYNHYLHYLQYDENEYIDQVLEDFGFSLQNISTYLNDREYYIEKFLYNSNPDPIYDNGTLIRYSSIYFSYSDIASNNGLKEIYNTNSDFYISCLLSDYKNIINTYFCPSFHQYNISIDYKENNNIEEIDGEILVKNSEFCQVNDERENIKKVFDKGLDINISMIIFSKIFILIELIIFIYSNYSSYENLFIICILLRIINIIFILVIFTHDVYIISKYSFDLEKDLCISYKKVSHAFLIMISIILLFIHFYSILLLCKLEKIRKFDNINEGNNNNDNNIINSDITEGQRENNSSINDDGDSDNRIKKKKKKLEKLENSLNKREKQLNEKENNLYQIQKKFNKELKKKNNEIQELEKKVKKLKEKLQKK